MSSRLPTSLEIEPLVDAIFEVRFEGEELISDLLPGALSAVLKPKPKHSRLPAAEIPLPLRSSDANLRYTPVAQLELERFKISVGDHSFAISCRLPYPKWPAFRSEIFKLIDHICELDLEIPINRYSIKYVNLIDASGIADQLSKVDIDLRIGGMKSFDEHVSIQVNSHEEELIQIIKIITNGHVQPNDGPERSGIVIDVDTIRNGRFSNASEFRSHLINNIDALRLSNKKSFFCSLKPEALEGMKPRYD